MVSAGDFVIRTLDATLDNILSGVVNAVPKVVTGLIFVTVAYVMIKVILAVVRKSLDRIYSEEQELIVNLGVTVVGIFLWFSVALSLLKIVGMGDIAASLGTAVGFIALGISYALSDMIADTVAGVYLLRDPDFSVGDTVVTSEATGVLKTIELRKSRIELENGDTTVVANSDIESGWTRVENPEGRDEDDESP